MEGRLQIHLIWGDVWSEEKRQTPVVAARSGADASDRILTGFAPFGSKNVNKEKTARGRKQPRTEEEKKEAAVAREAGNLARQAGRTTTAKRVAALTPEQQAQVKEAKIRARLGLEESVGRLTAGRARREWMPRAEFLRQIPSVNFCNILILHDL